MDNQLKNKKIIELFKVEDGIGIIKVEGDKRISIH